MSKEEIYRTVSSQLKSLMEGETDDIAKMANIAAVLHESFGFWWTGFYRVAGNELILGPFQGPVACMHIGYGRGVCGSAWERGETIIVPDVHQFKGHIACSNASNSEIVIPIRRNNEIVAVLDIDSKEFNTFDETDKCYLEEMMRFAFAG